MKNFPFHQLSEDHQSILKDKIGTLVASPLLILIDDPHLVDGMGSSSFDGEGVATHAKDIISQGILKTYLHSLTTAKVFGVNPTGNASRKSFKSSVNIAPTNMYIQPSKTSFDELVTTIYEGLYITDVQGLHAGLNSISGDFSLSASGFLIENGKITTPLICLRTSKKFPAIVIS